MLLIFLWPLSWTVIFKYDEFSLTQQSTVAAVQEKYMKDDENIDDD